MTNNHPNRGWRQRMQQSADQFLESPARVLYEMPMGHQEPGRALGLRNRLREAYLAGYQDGRKRS